MADYIDRQAAIDAFVDLYDRVAFFDKEIAARAIGIIKALPSAQPEIIRCKDCEWSEPVSGYLLCGAWEAKAVDKDDFCSDAERRTDDEGRSDQLDN